MTKLIRAEIALAVLTLLAVSGLVFKPSTELPWPAITAVSMVGVPCLLRYSGMNRSGAIILGFLFAGPGLAAVAYGAVAMPSLAIIHYHPPTLDALLYFFGGLLAQVPALWKLNHPDRPRGNHTPDF